MCFLTKKKKLLLLLNEALGFGLSKNDFIEIKILIDKNEYGLALDTLLTQLYEYDTQITVKYKSEIEEIIPKCGLDVEDYAFLEELIV